MWIAGRIKHSAQRIPGGRITWHRHPLQGISWVPILLRNISIMHCIKITRIIAVLPRRESETFCKQHFQRGPHPIGRCNTLHQRLVYEVDHVDHIAQSDADMNTKRGQLPVIRRVDPAINRARFSAAGLQLGMGSLWSPKLRNPWLCKAGTNTREPRPTLSGARPRRVKSSWPDRMQCSVAKESAVMSSSSKMWPWLEVRGGI